MLSGVHGHREHEPSYSNSSQADESMTCTSRLSIDESIELEPYDQPLFSPLNGHGRKARSDEDSFRVNHKKAEGHTAAEEATVLRKLDRHLVLFLAVLYMLSFLDRSSTELVCLWTTVTKRFIDIGNARIAGLAEDLQITSSQYENILTSFYITYIIFEPMTLCYRLVRPHIYIALCVASWGFIASLQSIARSYQMLAILRAFLGVSEAAFGPGVPFYLSFFYNREELALRTGFFISAAPLATSFASSLAWLIVQLGSHSAIAAWRLLFLVEGFPSVIVAIFAWQVGISLSNSYHQNQCVYATHSCSLLCMRDVSDSPRYRK